MDKALKIGCIIASNSSQRSIFHLIFLDFSVYKSWGKRDSWEQTHVLVSLNISPHLSPAGKSSYLKGFWKWIQSVIEIIVLQKGNIQYQWGHKKTEQNLQARIRVNRFSVLKIALLSILKFKHTDSMSQSKRRRRNFCARQIHAGSMKHWVNQKVRAVISQTAQGNRDAGMTLPDHECWSN